MKQTKDLKKNKGVTMISLIVTIALMLIIASITVYSSYDRFEINSYRKMINDIEYLNEKIANYYLKYNSLPILRNSSNEKVQYTYTKPTFANGIYYIVDLEAMDGIALNYGKEGFEKPNKSNDVYVIDLNSHQVFYVKGVKVKGEYRYTIVNKNNIDDTIPPSKPQIKIISGTKNEENIYTTDVEIEIIPGKDSVTDIDRTTCFINGVDTSLSNNICRITESGTYEIVAETYNKKGLSSVTSITINIEKPSET